MGGLIKRMPCFLIGSVAISGLPPLNRFVSEWMLFQSLLPGVTLPQPVAAALVTIAVGLLALTGGLAVAGFVKAFGVTFLAIPRSEAAEHAREAGMSMRLGMGLLAAACVELGLAPFVVAPRLGQAIAGLDGLPAVAPAFSFNLSLKTAESGSCSPVRCTGTWRTFSSRWWRYSYCYWRQAGDQLYPDNYPPLGTDKL